MMHPRVQDPPAYIEKEAIKLKNEFFAQYDDDDIIPDDAYNKYFIEHGSPEFVKYILDVFGG